MSKPTNCYVCGGTPRFDEESAEYVCDECEEERTSLTAALTAMTAERDKFMDAFAVSESYDAPKEVQELRAALTAMTADRDLLVTAILEAMTEIRTLIARVVGVSGEGECGSDEEECSLCGKRFDSLSSGHYCTPPTGEPHPADCNCDDCFDFGPDCTPPPVDPADPGGDS